MRAYALARGRGLRYRSLPFAPGLTSMGSRLVVRGDLSLIRCNIRGNMEMDGVWIGGSLLLDGTKLDGSIYARTGLAGGSPDGLRRHLTVLGRMDLSAIKAEEVDLEGAEIGLFRIVTGEIARLWLVPGIEEVDGWTDPAGPDGGPDHGPREPGRWRLRRCELGGLQIWSATFGHDIILCGVRVGDDGPEPEDVTISQVAIGGSLRFFSKQLWQALTDVPADPGDWEAGEREDVFEVRAEFPGDLDLAGLDVGDHLDLSNVQARGSIRLKDSIIGLDLRMAQDGPDDVTKEGRTRTTCYRLDVGGVTCKGDADLTGLEVVTRPVEGIASDAAVVPREQATPADVDARRLRVGGKLLFSAPLGPEPHDFSKIARKPEGRLDARVDGLLHLATAEAAHIVISGHSFQDPEPDQGISFERARFGRFQILDPLPACYDLSHLSVDRWDIPRAHLAEFLRRAVPFQRSTYLALERAFRNDGDDETADEVYRGMRRKAIGELDPAKHAAARDASAAGHSGLERWARRAAIRWRATRWRLWGLATGWGTQNFRPLLFGALLLPLSIAIFSQPANITASLEARGAGPASETVLDPARLDPSWGAQDGVWMALRYHVPIIPLLARADFVPSRSRATVPLPWTDAVVGTWFSAEGYAYSMYLLHWIIWPLFLVGLTSRIIRARE